VVNSASTSGNPNVDFLLFHVTTQSF